MADDVTITIGAAFDSLANGVNQARESIETLKTGVEALAAAFAIREIAEFVTHVTEAAEHTERLAITLGVTAETAQEFSILAQLSGTSADAFAMGLQRLQLNLQRGAQATSAQAAALRAMGLSVRELQGLAPDQQANRIADAYQRLVSQGINPANAMIILFGRNAAGLGAIFAGGSAGMEQWRQRMVEVGAVVSGETTKSLADLNKQFTLLGDSMKGLSATIVASLSGALGKLASEFATAAGNMSVLIQEGSLVNYVMEYLGDTADLLGAQLVKLGIILAQLGTFGFVNFDAALGKAQGAIDSANQSLRDLNANFERVANSFRAGLQFGGTATPLNVDFGLGKGMKDALKVADDAYAQLKIKEEAAVKTFQISEEQKNQILKAALLTRMNAEIAAGESRKVAEAKYNKDIEELNAKTAEKVIADWKKVADKFASDFSSALDEVLTKQKTFAQAMGQMFAKMIEQMIGELIKLIAEWVILNIVSGGTVSFGAVLSSALPSIPKFAAGTPMISQTGMAMVHEGEAIIPAHLNPFNSGNTTTNNAFGGSSSVNLTISAMDAQSFASWLRAGGGNMLSRYISNAWQQNPSLRPGYSQ